MIDATWIPLEWSGLSAFFDPATLALRRISFGEVELVRGIYVALRNQNWATIPGAVSQLRLEKHSDGFDLTFHVHHQAGDIDFEWVGTILANGTTVSFEMDGRSRSKFRKNRLGFCALHPIRECSGRHCLVTHSDGSETRGSFPDVISPHQPFFDIQSIRHMTDEGIGVQLDFKGDVFEMEDQRNWTDASYKTYCTPLAVPFPAAVSAGQAVTQRVRLEITKPARTESAPATDPRIHIRLLDGPTYSLPEIGTCLSNPEVDTDQLGRLGLSHLRVEAQPGTELIPFAELARNLTVPLEVALHPGFDGTDPRLRDLPIKRFLAYGPRTSEEIDGLRAIAPVYLGTNAYFAELNRDRPRTDGMDGLCFSINPQVHAFDDASVMETLEAQAPTVTTAKQFSHGLPIVISPITLLPRFNPVATTPDTDGPPATDPRQTTDFTAAWTLGSIAALAAAGTKSITYFETHGPRGILGTPAEQVIRRIGQNAGSQLKPVQVSQPSGVAALAFRTPQGLTWILSNLTPEPQRVTLDLTQTEVDLKPFEVKQLEGPS